MKVVSPEEEKAHYNAVVKGGLIGGAAGIGLGLLSVYAAGRRYKNFRTLTLPFRAFLVSSVGTFGAMVHAERYSNEFHFANNPMYNYKGQASRDADLLRANETSFERFRKWGETNRYTIVFTSWVAAMVIALGIVSRNKYLSGPQKLVQARVYAQGLTLAVLVASAAFETADARSGKGRWETIMVLDPDDPEHKKLIEKRIHKEEYEGQDLWRDMVAAEERRLALQKEENAQAEHK